MTTKESETTREAMHNSWDKKDPKDAQVLLHVLKTGVTQHVHDLLANQIHDFQNLSLTYAQISLEETRTQHRLLTHHLPLYFRGSSGTIEWSSFLASHLLNGRSTETTGINEMPLRNVLLEELRDMYSAENQLVKALPKLANGARDKALKAALQAHLEETKGQVIRLKTVFELLREKPIGQHCSGMEGIIEEGADALEKVEKSASFDAGIVGAALRSEYYEIAGYEACIAMAEHLGERKVASLLGANLREELSAAKNITKIGLLLSKSLSPSLMRNQDQ